MRSSWDANTWAAVSRGACTGEEVSIAGVDGGSFRVWGGETGAGVAAITSSGGMGSSSARERVPNVPGPMFLRGASPSRPQRKRTESPLMATLKHTARARLTAKEKAQIQETLPPHWVFVWNKDRVDRRLGRDADLGGGPRYVEKQWGTFEELIEFADRYLRPHEVKGYPDYVYVDTEEGKNVVAFENPETDKLEYTPVEEYRVSCRRGPLFKIGEALEEGRLPMNKPVDKDRVVEVSGAPSSTTLTRLLKKAFEGNESLFNTRPRVYRFGTAKGTLTEPAEVIALLKDA